MTKEKISEQVVEFVLSCTDEVLKKITVNSLASRFNVNRSHLAREFKANKRITLCKFIQGEKMARAALLLRNSNEMTVENLSKRLGFCSAEYFREVFKRHFAVSPSIYRQYKTNRNRGNFLKI